MDLCPCIFIKRLYMRRNQKNILYDNQNVIKSYLQNHKNSCTLIFSDTENLWFNLKWEKIKDGSSHSQIMQWYIHGEQLHCVGMCI